MRGIAAKLLFPIQNDSGEAIPPFSVVMVKSVLTNADKSLTWSTVTKYDGSAGNIMVTGDTAIPATRKNPETGVIEAGRGSAAYDDFLYVAVTGAPLSGVEFGPVAGQWTISSGGQGFVAQGAALTGETPKRALFYRNTSGSSGSGTVGCGCCNCFNCSKNTVVSIGGCAGCKKAATEKYTITISYWFPWPALSGSFELTYAGDGEENPCLWVSDTICVTALDGGDDAPEGCYQWQLDLSGLPTLNLVYISGDDVIEIVDSATLYQSDTTWNCQCESKLLGILPDNIGSVEGLSCTVCVVPNGTYQCCCNCFHIDWPGITVNSDSEDAQGLLEIASAFEVQLIDGANLAATDSVCDKYWENGDFTEPNPHYCRWVFNSSYGPPAEFKPGFGLAVIDTYSDGVVTRSVILTVTYTDVTFPSGCTFASQMRYICKDFTCAGGTFVACADINCTDTSTPGDGIDSSALGSHGCSGDGPILDDPSATVEYPPTIFVTAMACTDPSPPDPPPCSNFLGTCCYEDEEGEAVCVEDTSQCDCIDLNHGELPPCWNDSHVDGHPTCEEVSNGSTGGCSACVDCACEDATKCAYSATATESGSPTGYFWNLSIAQCAALGCECPGLDSDFYELHGYPEEFDFLFTACRGCAA